MKKGGVPLWLLVILMGSGWLFLKPQFKVLSQSSDGIVLITGTLHDPQGQPIEGAQVSLKKPGEQTVYAESLSQPNGWYELSLSATNFASPPVIHIQREHYQTIAIELTDQDWQQLKDGQAVVLGDNILTHHIGVSFWLAAFIFVAMLVLIALGKLHNTLAALLGASIIFLISYLGRPLNEDLFIFDFHGSLKFVDWNVIFLIMGMMIVIAVVERTGIFQWLAFTAYRLSGGRLWLLVIILMVITGIASAFLDNVTTMLLMTPISVQIALAMGVPPLALLLPEVFSSNVVGISTLVGTPTNILIGSYGNISFNDFLTNLTPGVVLAMVGLIAYCELIYRKELRITSSGKMSDMLLQRLSERAKITEPEHLKKAGVIGAAMLVLFVAGDLIHLLPAVTALMGATALLIWIRPDIEEMIEAVDWTTLVFFITLFIVVGAIQEVGLVSLIADGISNLIGGNLVAAMIVVTWSSALLSTVIANIPFTAAMLPVIGYLTLTVPGAQSKVLFYCLSVGAAMGGNGSLIGASANMVTAGIAERAGYPISYALFFKKGFPALLITVSLTLVWLFLRFFAFHAAGNP